MNSDYEVCPKCGNRIAPGTSVCPYCQFVLYSEDDDIHLPSLKQEKHSSASSSAASTHTFTSLNLETVREPEESVPVSREEPSWSDDSSYEEEEPVRRHRKKKKSSGFKYVLLFVLLTAVLLCAGFIGVNVLLGNDLPFGRKEEKTADTATPSTAPVPSSTPVATPSTTPEATTSSEPEEPVSSTLGHVVITADAIRIRTEPSTQAQENGSATSGQEYDVYEESNDGTYTWYRIGEDQWVPTDGTWMTFTANH